MESITLAGKDGDDSDRDDISSDAGGSVELKPEVVLLSMSPERDASPSNADSTFERDVMPLFYIPKNGF